MLIGIACLFFFQMLGTLFVALTGLPVPETVIGMLFFILALKCIRPLYDAVLPIVNLLMAQFSFFFVPAGVGVIQYLDLLRQEWFAITCAIVVSSILAMVTTIAVERCVMHFMHIED